MKAVIVEIRDKFAAVLLDDGRIVKVKNNNYAIGKVIEMKKNITKKSKKIAIWAASAAAFIIMSSTGAYVYASPYSYVSLDVNPSIEYSLNRFDHVISVKAVNSDGEEILKKIDIAKLSNKKIDEALALTVDQLSKDGYFDDDTDGGIVIATSAKDIKMADKLATKLQQSVKADTEENGDTVEVEAISVGKERVQKAKELGVTPGKLNLVEKLQASSSTPESINAEEWLKKPVREIMKAIKDNKKDQKEIKKEEKDTAKAKTEVEKKEQKFASNTQSEVEKRQEKATTNLENARVKAEEVASKLQEKLESNVEKEKKKVEKFKAIMENRTNEQEKNTSSVQEQNNSNEEQRVTGGENRSNQSNNGVNSNR